MSNTELDCEEGLEHLTVDAGEPEMVFALFVHRLVGLMLITEAFPLGSWVNNESDVGGPLATPHIPCKSPLRATHRHPGLNSRYRQTLTTNKKRHERMIESEERSPEELSKRNQVLFYKRKHIALLAELWGKLDGFGYIMHVAAKMAPWGCFSLSV